MGFYSFLTADTKESIPVSASERFDGRPVYLLQPNGLPPIEEPEYEGYGVFGGVDCHCWIASNNAHLLRSDAPVSELEMQIAGIMMTVGTLLLHVPTNTYHSVFHSASSIMRDVPHYPVNYETIIPCFGKTANQMLATGEFKSVPVHEVADIKYPLKFSFNKDAVYEDLPPSGHCAAQGIYYDDEDDSVVGGSA